MNEEERTHDILIVGLGPAGAQAAIHACGRRANVAMAGKVEGSSLARAHIENYWGLTDEIDGKKLVERGIEQARRLGATIILEDVVRIMPQTDCFESTLESGLKVCSISVVLAPGVHRNRLGVEGEKELIGRGVSYCVDCDAGFFRGRPVAIFGDGSAAAEGALVLSRFASKTYLIIPGARLPVQDSLWQEVQGTVELVPNATIEKIVGAEKVQAVKLQDGRVLHVDGLFIELGAKGLLDLCANLGIFLDDSGFIPTGDEQQTDVPGIFAAGDVCGPPFQVAKAVGEGCIAGLSAAVYASKRRREMR